jgi:hypothetical protein
VQCSHLIVTGVNAQASQITVNKDLFFDATGQPTNGTTPTVTVQPTDSCNVTETATGGALTVTYACVAHTSGSPQCQTNNQDVNYGEPGPPESATVTVTNTFPVAVVTPVVVQPAFTG